MGPPATWDRTRPRQTHATEPRMIDTPETSRAVARSPLDAELFGAELNAGQNHIVPVTLSVTHLFCLSSAAHLARQRRDCPDAMRLVLEDFLRSVQHANVFGEQMRLALAQQSAAYREHSTGGEA